MKRELVSEQMQVWSAVGLMVALAGCSTTEMTPIAPPTARAPDYIGMPHPTGFDLGDIKAAFNDKRALSPELLGNCDADWFKLQNLTQSEDERREGARELVRSNPVVMHWCFYGRILDLEAGIKQDDYVDQKQKRVLKTYSFLVPIARAFMSEYKDSRYLRWAVRHYRRISEVVFFRKLELAPQMTLELVEVTNPFGAWKQPQGNRPVLEKYNIVSKELPAPEKPLFPPPVPEESREPAAAPSPSPEPEPEPAPEEPPQEEGLPPVTEVNGEVQK